MSKKPITTINLDNEDYQKAHQVILSLAKQGAENHPQMVKVFEAGPESEYPPPGSIGFILLPPLRGETGGNGGKN